MINTSDWEDYYQILGVDPNASQEEIKKAWRYKANIFHPDRMKGMPESVRRQAGEDLKKINEAYAVLRDPEKRREYHTEWLRRKGKPEEELVPKPKPVVDPPCIRFKDVKPGEVQRASFVIRNVGGPYTRIWISNPDSWVRTVRWYSLTTSDELPLQVEIEAEGENWRQNYLEYITVRLDEEETQVRIELQTKPEPVREKEWVVPKARPTPPSSAVRVRRRLPVLIKWALGLSFALVILLIGALMGLPGLVSFVDVPGFLPIPNEDSIYILDVHDGSQMRLATGHGPVWSPDGKKIAFALDAQGPPNVYVVNADGSNRVRLTAGGVCYSWSPDGRKIAFEIRHAFNRYYTTAVAVIDADGSNLIEVSSPMRKIDGSRSMGCPSWSSDGKIAFATGDDRSYTYVMNSDGSGLRKVAEGGGLAWSPDGKKAAFWRANGEGGYKSIYVIDSNGSGLRKLAEGSRYVWSPDGKKIAFHANDHIHLVNTDGSNHVELTKGSQPIWSPDGKRIAFRKGDDLHLIDAEGDNRISILLEEGRDPCWSPDGKIIAFTKGSDIYLVDSDGSNYIRFVKEARYPVWSPDGRKIAFTKDG